MKNPFVFFDLGNVLVKFDHQIAVDQLAELADRPAEAVRHAVFDNDLQNRYEAGQIDSQAFCQAINHCLETGLEDRDILEAISAIFTLNRAILPVLEQLRAQGLPLGLLSNTCPAHWQWILRQGWPVPGDWFEPRILSYEVQAMKPDANIYAVCEKLTGRQPAELFFIDDRPENVEGARRRGWEAHCYESTQDLLSHLQQWLAR